VNARTKPCCWTAAALACLALALAAHAPAARASSFSSRLLGYFPKDIGEFGYADLKTARQAPWFAQFQSQILPPQFRQFTQFLSGAGIDPNSQVNEIAWGAVNSSSTHSDSGAAGAASGSDPSQPPQIVGEQIVGIAVGNFTPELTDQYYAKQQMPRISVRGYTIYAFGAGVSPTEMCFFYFDPSTAAFGHRALLEKMIGVSFGDEESFLANSTLFPLVNEVNGDATIWAALDQNYAHLGISQLLPESAQFPGADALLSRVKSMTVKVDADHGLDAQVTPICGSPGDALTLAQLLQAGLLLKRYQQAQSNPDMARVIDATSVSADGDHLRIRSQISDDLLQSLLARGAFSLRM
jgi:hypothetical protein